MTVDIGQQLIILALAALLGAAGGVLYDAFKVLRLVGVNGKVACFVEDLLFFAILTVSIFSFQMRMTDGKIRIFVLLGMFAGFVLYSLTLERLVFFLIQKLYAGITAVLSFIYEKLILPPFRLLRRTFGRLLAKPGAAVKKFFCQKRTLFSKNRLTRDKKMVYNKAGISKRRKDQRNNGSRETKTSQKTFYC